MKVQRLFQNAIKQSKKAHSGQGGIEMKICEVINFFQELKSIRFFTNGEEAYEPSIKVEVSVTENGKIYVSREGKYVFFNLDEIEFLIESLQKIQEAM